MGQFTKNVESVASQSSKKIRVTNDNGINPIAGTITAVVYRPAMSITGGSNNTRKFVLIKSGADVMASLTLGATTFPGGMPIQVTLASDSDARKSKTTDGVEWSSEAVGQGVEDPGGKVTITFDAQ
jgi:hypothetical protein